MRKFDAPIKSFKKSPSHNDLIDLPENRLPPVFQHRIRTGRPDPDVIQPLLGIFQTPSWLQNPSSVRYQSLGGFSSFSALVLQNRDHGFLDLVMMMVLLVLELGVVLSQIFGALLQNRFREHGGCVMGRVFLRLNGGRNGIPLVQEGQTGGTIPDAWHRDVDGRNDIGSAGRIGVERGFSGLGRRH